MNNTKINAGLVKKGQTITYFVESSPEQIVVVAKVTGIYTLPSDTIIAWVDDDLRVDFDNVRMY